MLGNAARVRPNDGCCGASANGDLTCSSARGSGGFGDGARGRDADEDGVKDTQGGNGKGLGGREGERGKRQAGR